MTRRRTLLAGFAAIVIVALLAAIWWFMLFATPPQETLDQRVYDVASQLKCPVCQGESVANSPALISQQMRALIRQQLQSGMTEQQSIQYFRSRYGDRILWSPPQQGFTLLAWLVPPAVLLLGALLVFFVLRNWGRTRRAAQTRSSEELVDQHELEQFQAQYERELAAEDALFARQSKEAS
ncbi:MAG TPA: cytochrome c-type biogenesis protein [Ktedonobacteraceae bacterium]|nr:cytochrome c-type biogenesis protein [Ktedonobacteraceae bacterium]